MSTKSEGGRVFTTVSHVGPFPPSHTFTESEFNRLNKPPENAGEGYHGGLIQRLLDLKVITETPDSAPMVTPIGPLNQTEMAAPAPAPVAPAVVVKK